MTRYVAALKSRQAETTALGNTKPTTLAQMHAVVEVVPDDDRDKHIETFCKRISQARYQPQSISIDLGLLHDDRSPVDGSTLGPLPWIAGRLRVAGVAVVPVFRPNDNDGLTAEVRAVNADHHSGGCLRVGSVDTDPDPHHLRRHVPRALQKTGLSSGDVDLLVDVGEVNDSRTVTRAKTVATRTLDWAQTSGPWRSVTLLSGAFPPSISDLPKDTDTAIRRYDAQLWTQVHQDFPDIDFGDFGIANPRWIQREVFRGPLPNLRYTKADNWRVFRQSKNLPGHEDFYTLCATVVGSSYWPASGQNYSWGDSQIARCAAAAGGPGSATQWLAYGFSHHFEHVTERLARFGVP